MSREAGAKTPRGPLARYREKRDFAVTPEPPPEAPPPPHPTPTARPLFMVHKHDASRLHYDLRLETGGVLASWAIPRGPSYDPADRRLAVETEDHPLAYGDFEGRIPEGEYGAGDSIIWDRGTYDTDPPGQFETMKRRGHLVLRLDGEKLQGRWHLVRTHGGAASGGKTEWLFFKGRDEHARSGYDVVEARPESVVSGRRVTRGPLRKSMRAAPHPAPLDLLIAVWPPMLAAPGSLRVIRDECYLLEAKYDGYRALAGVSGGRVALQSRNGRDLAARFPSLIAPLAAIEAAEAVLDGEVVSFDSDRVAHFQDLASGRGDLEYLAFDLLWLDGVDLRRRPIEERRDLLESVLANLPADSPVRLAERITAKGEAALQQALEAGLEGVIAKRCGSTYHQEGSRRSDDWLKLKLLHEQEFAIVGYLAMSGATDQLGALLVAVAEEGGFRYAGKVGTGYTAVMRRELVRLLDMDRLARPFPALRDPPRYRSARWVRPRHVASVCFSAWTREGRLRHPSFRGLRDDKSVEECVRESSGVALPG
ncbi:MAG TPA: non-homologous end-joining DNA ligase [Polyangia bacterium]|nr:non-homologous end-joining DNA ligase [Polyangia bacterium]